MKKLNNISPFCLLNGKMYEQLFNYTEDELADFHKAIKPENWEQYKEIPNSHLYLKFVVQDEYDVEEIKSINFGSNWKNDIYLMPCGGTAEMLADTKFNVAEIAMKHGFKYSPRLHVDLFGNKWGT